MVKISPAMTMVGSGVQSPRVAMFSSRGPGALFPGIIKVRDCCHSPCIPCFRP
ncbi:hypothetical protein BAE44_0010328 [Dichanthelium oligosanthes]|uniref:Uncharacterized protein n=1 Tax=Dichanthelium oligosanthes TaxID=888268 RepID=A0A1E5VU48_9POAL|nr:hypothetical protein BAE44_0010328 [Dichanthelium oligosanthes]